jgi:hypothetical protein
MNKDQVQFMTNRFKIIAISLLTFCLAGIYWACVIGDLTREGLQCFQGKCLDGWRCDLKIQRCVKVIGEIPPTEPTDESIIVPEPIIAEKITESITPEEPPPTIDGGEIVPEDQIIEEPPQDIPPALQCPYRKATINEFCPIPQEETNSCEQLGKTFQLSTEQLPQAISDATAISNGANWNLRFELDPKVYIYLIGGRTSGTTSDKIYLTKVSDQGQLSAWTETSTLLQARYSAYAFLKDGYLYVIGGMTSETQAANKIERAKLKDNGSLESFEDVGTWNDPRPKAGYAFMYGYFYRIGGLNAQGTPVTNVERVLLQPHGKIALPETLKPLPEGRTEPLVSTKHHLYVLGANGSRNSLIARILPDGDLEGWCPNTPLPAQAKSFNAITDVRRILLSGLQNLDDKLEDHIFLSPLFGTNDPRANPHGGGLDSWRCSKSPQLQTKLLTARRQSTSVVALNFFYIIGGVDASGNPLQSVEIAPLAYRESGCDLDRDLIPNNFDFCPNTYDPPNLNSDQPEGVRRPGDPLWIPRFGLGNACEYQLMSLIPASSFTRGSDQNPDAPSREISLDGFYIDIHEVNNKDYAECVKLGKCTPPKQTASATRPDYYNDQIFADYPVVNVTWQQAEDYCKFRGKRLPFEAEWEKAARGLSKNSFPWGDSAPTCQIAQFQDCTEKDTLPPGQLTDGNSPYGARDMAGNVREWVFDFYGDQYYKQSSDKNPQGPKDGTERAVRGGSFLSPADNLRVFNRDKLAPNSSANDLGFR